MTLIANRLSARIFASASLTQPGRVYRQAAGARNEFGEFVPGGFSRTNVRLVSVPMSGAERLVLPENLREVETRKFYIAGEVDAITDVTSGDALWTLDRFYRAEIVRDWAGYREVIASFPFSGDITELLTGGFSNGFGAGFNAVA